MEGGWEERGKEVRHQKTTIEMSVQRHPIIRWNHNSSESHAVGSSSQFVWTGLTLSHRPSLIQSLSKD